MQFLVTKVLRKDSKVVQKCQICLCFDMISNSYSKLETLEVIRVKTSQFMYLESQHAFEKHVSSFLNENTSEVLIISENFVRRFLQLFYKSC